MDIENIVKSLETAQKETFVKFVSDKGPNSCPKCLEHHGKVFKADDPDKPGLPIHPNCRCKYEIIEDKEIEKVNSRLQQMLEQLRRYAEEATSKAAELIDDAKELLGNIDSAKSTAERLKFTIKSAALTILLQCVLFTMEKINDAADLLKNIMAKLHMEFVNPFVAIGDFHQNRSEIKRILKEIHYMRLNSPDQIRELLPKSPDEALKRGFVEALDKENWYHRNKGQTGNKKYYHRVTGQEVIFDKDGKFVSDPENIGTKNYVPDFSDSMGKVMHGFYDVLPYWIWGNSEKDTTPVWTRIWGTGK